MEMKRFNKAAIVALMAAFMVGVFFIILGSVSVELIAGLGINAAQFGTLVFAMFLTCCIVQLFIGPMVDKVGYKPVLVFGFILSSLGMLILAFASDFTFSLIACVLFGISAMSLSTASATLVPVILFNGKDPARANNFSNAFFSVGYILTPLLVVLLIKILDLPYNSALIVISIFSLICLVFTLTATFPAVTPGFKISMAFEVITKPAVLIAAIALFCYISLEVSLGTWIRKLMEEIYAGSSTVNAVAKTGFVLSLFGVAMMVGRFITSGIKNLTAIGHKLIIFMSLIALLSILLMIVAKSPALGIVSIALAGLVFAPIFPTIVGVTFSKFEPGLYGSIYGIVFSIGLLGGTFIPKIIGNLSIGSTVQQSLLITAVMAAVLLIISFFIGSVGKSKDNK
jgi:fucose permease